MHKISRKSMTFLSVREGWDNGQNAMPWIPVYIIYHTIGKSDAFFRCCFASFRFMMFIWSFVVDPRQRL